METTASFAMSKHMLQTNIESSFFSSSSLRSRFVEVLLFSGEGVKEYCVDLRGSLPEVVGSESGKTSPSHTVSCDDVGDDIFNRLTVVLSCVSRDKLWIICTFFTIKFSLCNLETLIMYCEI